MKPVHTDQQQEWRTDVSPEELKAVYHKRVQNGAILLCFIFGAVILALVLVIVFSNSSFSEAVMGGFAGCAVLAAALGASKLAVHCPVCGAWLPFARSIHSEGSRDEPFDEGVCFNCGANFREGRLPEALEREKRPPVRVETLRRPIRSKTPYQKAPEIIRAQYAKQCGRIKMLLRILPVAIVLGIFLEGFGQISEEILCAVALCGAFLWFALIILWMRCPACGAMLNQLSTGGNPNRGACVCPKCLTNLLTGEPEQLRADEDTSEADKTDK